MKSALKVFKSHGRWIFLTLMIVFLGAAFLIKEVQESRRVGLPSIQSGPWGEMMVWDIRIQQPEEYVGFIKLTGEGPFWNFGLASEKTVEQILASSGCSESEVRGLLAARVAQPNDDFVIQPPEKLLLSLDRNARAKLYLKLAANKKNFYQANPILVPGGNLAPLLHGEIKDPGRIQALYEKLSYQRNGFTYFSDPEIILRNFGPDSKERDVFLKFLTTIRAVSASILVKPDTQIEMPVMYWGLPTPGLRVKDLYPLFEAQKSIRGGGAVPLSTLLPEKAKASLYKTPRAGSASDIPPNCHFTALFFFSPRPDPRVADPDFASQYLQQNYYEIGKPTLTGDLVLLINSKNEVVHTAVHLAGDIVYSKNGVNIAQPWVLMREHDMVGLFSALEPMRVGYMRWNQL